MKTGHPTTEAPWKLESVRDLTQQTKLWLECILKTAPGGWI